MIKDRDYENQSGLGTNLSRGGAYYISTVEASMPDGRPDAWSTLPLSVLAGGAQVRNHEESSSSVEAYKVGGSRNLRLTERDYIGLSESSMATQLASSNHEIKVNKAYDLECKDTELRLGIGPCSNGGVSSADVAQDGSSGGSTRVSFQGLSTNLGKLYMPDLPKQDAISPLHHVNPSLNQTFWQSAQALIRVNGAAGDHLSGGEPSCYVNNYPWGPGLAPGRFVIPVPKVGTVPAKRPYLEAIGDNRAANSCNATHTTTNNNGNMGNMGGSANFNTSADAAQMHSNSSSTLATPAAAAGGGGGGGGGGAGAGAGAGGAAAGAGGAAAGGGGGLYTWSTNAMQLPGGWQHMNFDGKTRALPPTPPAYFKVPPTPASHNQPPVASTGSEPSPSSNGEAFHKSTKSSSLDSQNEESRNKAPVVGWPPVRSFRKNTLQATHGNKVNTEDQPENAPKGGGSGDSEVPEQSNNNKNAFYVKAKLDGVRICRKVDLKSYDSYDSLKSSLQEMFQAFVNDNAKLDLMHGNNYVLTHEDKDGDWMLVGDVPWHMFVASTVKSFRIMKAVDAIGLGERVSAKLKAQANCRERDNICF